MKKFLMAAVLAISLAVGGSAAVEVEEKKPDNKPYTIVIQFHQIKPVPPQSEYEKKYTQEEWQAIVDMGAGQDQLVAIVGQEFFDTYLKDIELSFSSKLHKQQYTLRVEGKKPTPTVEPTPTPTIEPTIEPTLEPTTTPEVTVIPTITPTIEPTITPEVTVEPTIQPTITPEVTETPTVIPTVTPTPTVAPTDVPTVVPTTTPVVTIAPTPTPQAHNIPKTGDTTSPFIYWILGLLAGGIATYILYTINKERHH